MPRPQTPDILAGLGQGDDGGLAAAMGPQVMALNIADVRLDGGTQPRAGIDQAVVADYANDMEANGAEFPPVQVVYDGQEYWLWDGFHRLHARKRNGLYTVPAIVRQGTRRDAVLLSVGANATHGFRRTNEDKRRAVLALLHDEEWAQWSDREIARRCAVDNSFVSRVRKELSVDGQQIETRRVQRNGTEYTMATPQRSAAPAVASQSGNYATPDELDAAVRSWLVAYDTRDEQEAALAEVMELGENSVTFDDLREWIEVKPRQTADLLQAAERVLAYLRHGPVGPGATRPAKPQPAPEPYDPMELVEELVALESVALDGVDEAWLFEYMEGIAKRRNRSFDRRTFDAALRDAIRRQIADNERRQRLETARAAALVADVRTAAKAAKPFVPADIEEQVEEGAPVLAQPSTSGREASPVQTVNWQRTRGTVTEDGRILVQMSDGTKNPPWLELDDAGQHWMLDMIQRAQEVRA